MKNSVSAMLTFIALLNFSVGLAQDPPTINSNLPQVVPPSPTVAGLMKFEEVPVNNYTGIPDISIPLFSTGTLSKDISVDLSLKYHPSGIAVNEEAGYVGLGWSLFAGGSISRTVRGLPDELNEINKRYGIHMYDHVNGNKYYQVVGLLGNIQTEEENDLVNSFFWNAQEKGMYDTEHDLYQFNFMGYSGRFYIKRNPTGYQVVRLDNDDVVTVSYHPDTNTFTLWDDRGYKYEFLIKEVTHKGGTISQYKYWTGNAGNSNLIRTGFSDGYNYVSAFHLSKIYDLNGNLLVDFKYFEQEFDEGQSDVTSTSVLRNQMLAARIDIINSWYLPDGGGYYEAQITKFDPIESESSSSINTRTKKLESIIIEGKAKIYFTLEGGRLDSDNEGAYRLKEVLIKDIADNLIKKFELQHSYSGVYVSSFSTYKKRMVLSGLLEKDSSNNKLLPYAFSYVQPENTNDIFGVDYWGYFRSSPSWVAQFTREPSRQACRIDALQKMSLPTGGCIIYDFQPNTYSYVGDQPLSDFDENYDNWIDEPSYTMGISTDEAFCLPVSYNTRYAIFTPSIVSGDPGIYTLYEMEPGSNCSNPQITGTVITSFNCGQDGDDCHPTSKIELEPNKVYKLVYSNLNIGGGTANVQIKILEKLDPQLQYLYGGGVRIENIGWFKEDVSQFYFDNHIYQGGVLPDKKINYNYNFFNNVNRSSGSLTYLKPTFNYSKSKDLHIEYWGGEYSLLLDEEEYTVDYDCYTTFNTLSPIRTQGADVGYQNVTVTQEGFPHSNGKTQYTYTSPIDEPEADYEMTTSFIPPRNIDHRRGLLKKKRIFSVLDNLLKESVYNYTFEEELNNNTGLVLHIGNQCRFGYRYSTFEGYYSKFKACLPPITAPDPSTCVYLCGMPTNYIGYGPKLEAFGWAKLIDKTTKEYFYTRNNTQIIETQENFDYADNRKMSYYSKKTYVAGTATENISTEYYYYPNLGINRRCEIDRVENYNNGELISTQKMVYAPDLINTTSSNTPITNLPQYIKESKGSNNLEPRVQFLSYNQYNNPLEVRKEGGIIISYIWGYNSTQPIAMVENASYEEIATALGITETTLLSYNESNMAQLNNLRSLMPQSRITTYTYIPLVGVSSVTDSRGRVTTYEYDTFGRLKTVRDHEGKLLSENAYQYRTEQP